MSNIQRGAPQFNTAQFVQSLQKSSNSDVVRLSGGNQGELVIRSKFKEGLTWIQSGRKSEETQANNRASARVLVEKLLADPNINKKGISGAKATNLINRLSEKPITVELAKRLVYNLQDIEVISAKGLWKAMGLGTESKIKQAYRFLKGVAKGNLGADIDGTKTESITKISSGRSQKEQEEVNRMKEVDHGIRTTVPEPPKPEVPIEEPKVTEEPKPLSMDEFLKELKERVDERRQRMEQVSSNPSASVLTEGERDQLVNVLKQVLNQDESVSTLQSSEDRLSESEINQVVDVLRQIAPEGVEDVAEHQQVEQNPGEVSSQEPHSPGSSVQSINPDGLTDDVHEDLSHTYSQEDEVAKPQPKELEYVDLRDPNQPTVGGSGPSKDEINDLAAILSGRPTKKDIEGLLERLSN